MIKHIVLFTLKDQNTGRELKERLMALPAQIAEILYYEVGLHIEDSDGKEDASRALLISHFANLATLKAYRVHPAHVELLRWLHDQQRLVEVQALDCESSESP